MYYLISLTVCIVYSILLWGEHLTLQITFCLCFQSKNMLVFLSVKKQHLSTTFSMLVNLPP